MVLKESKVLDCEGLSELLKQHISLAMEKEQMKGIKQLQKPSLKMK